MQKERPILFSSPMVQALLAGTKTMTRRTTGLDKVNENPNDWRFTGMYIEGANTDKPVLLASFQSLVSVQDVKFIKCPYGEVGDLLWVREKFNYRFEDKTQPAYAADMNDATQGIIKWKPSIHMPKAAARIWLEITNVRFERLMDITEKDAVAEGIENLLDNMPDTEPTFRNYMHHPPIKEAAQRAWEVCADSAEHSFETLWHSINGEESWNANPWVWVVEFKKVSHE
jgi:hypothetical protein